MVDTTDGSALPALREGRLSVGGFRQVDLGPGQYAMLMDRGLWSELGTRTHQEIRDHGEYEFTGEELEALHTLLLAMVDGCEDVDVDLAAPDGSTRHFHLSAAGARSVVAELVSVVAVAQAQHEVVRLVL